MDNKEQNLMISKKKQAFWAAVLILLVSIIGLWGWQKMHRMTPNKPDSIPRGDYSYTIDYADELTNGVWTVLQGPDVGSNGVTTVSDPGDADWRDYRIRVTFRTCTSCPVSSRTK